MSGTLVDATSEKGREGAKGGRRPFERDAERASVKQIEADENRKMPRRGAVLVASSAICGMTGATYMWSIFSGPLASQHGWSSAEVSLAYSCYFVTVCIAAFLSGTLQKRFSIRWICMAASVLMGIAWLSVGICESLPQLYVCFSLLGGMGGGLSYNAVLSAATKWYPEKRGFANGICLGTNGLMPLVFAPLAGTLLEAFGFSEALYVVAGLVFAVVFSMSWFVKTPESDWALEGLVERGKDSADISVDGGAMVKTPLFWAMLVAFFFLTVVGAGIIGHLASIGSCVAGMTAAQASLQIAALALGNFVGRLGLGALSDRVGRCETLILCMIITAIDMLFVMPSATSFALFAISVVLVGISYGGVLSVMPSLCSDAFGMKNFGQNYALVFVGFTIASFVGPMAIAVIFDAVGAYDAVFALAAAMAIAGMVVSAIVKVMQARWTKKMS